MSGAEAPRSLRPSLMRKQFSKALNDHRDEIVALWMDRISSDDRIESDDQLSERALRDHVPQVIEEIAEYISRDVTPDGLNITEGRVSAYLRFRQGYRAKDLVAEVSTLRAILFDFLARFLSEDNSETAAEHYHYAGKVINLYLDEALRYAFAIFTEDSA